MALHGVLDLRREVDVRRLRSTDFFGAFGAPSTRVAHFVRYPADPPARRSPHVQRLPSVEPTPAKLIAHARYAERSYDPGPDARLVVRLFAALLPSPEPRHCQVLVVRAHRSYAERETLSVSPRADALGLFSAGRTGVRAGDWTAEVPSASMALLPVVPGGEPKRIELTYRSIAASDMLIMECFCLRDSLGP